MLSSQKCNVTNYGFAPITTVVWRFTVTVHAINFIMIFNVWGAIEVTLIGIFSLHFIGKTVADTGK